MRSGRQKRKEHYVLDFNKPLGELLSLLPEEVFHYQAKDEVRGAICGRITDGSYRGILLPDN
jgi:hypothetical protein